MTRIVHSALKLANLIWELFASATGGFMFVRGFNLVSGGNNHPDRVASRRTASPEFKPFAGAGIAIFLLAFIAGEALRSIYAFRYETPAATLAPKSSATLRKLVTIPIAIPGRWDVHRNLDRTGQAITLEDPGQSKLQTGGKEKGLVRSSSSAFLPAN
jgi:hypothetical protein